MPANPASASVLPVSATLFALMLGLTPAAAHADFEIIQKNGVGVRYVVTPQMNASERHLDVMISFDIKGTSEKAELQMPVWSPGDYHVQNHGKNVQNLTASVASDQGKSAAATVTHPDANTWDVALPAGTTRVTVNYSVPETTPGIFSENVKLQTHFGFVNGPAAYLYVAGHKTAGCSIEVKPPATWTTTMPLPLIEQNGEVLPSSFKAADYDTLADSPLVFGDRQGLKVQVFQQDGVDYRLVLARNPDKMTQATEMMRVIKALIKSEGAIMGPPVTGPYSFIFDLDGPGGGLEHLNSFRIGYPSFVPPARLADMVAHEYFHHWNVKRIRPEVLGPFDYINPPKTNNLWFAEGVTEYYAQIATHRAGLSTANDLLQHFGQMIGYYNTVAARKTVSAEESSYRVWEANNSSGYGGLNYYLKGELIGLLLDLKIRALTAGGRSLDDVMRLLYKRHNFPNAGYTEDELRTVVNEVAGQDISAYYNRLVRETAELPLDEAFGPFGLADDVTPAPGATPAMRRMREAWLEGTN